MRQAREHTELPLTMTATKNLYENKLLLQLINQDYDEGAINEIVE